MMLKNTSILALVFLVFACESRANEIFTTPHGVMVKTIKNGSAAGTIVGEMAEQFTTQFGTSSPLYVEAKVIGDFPSKECKRIEITWTKKSVPTPKGLSDAVLVTKINYCFDGSAPSDQKENK